MVCLFGFDLPFVVKETLPMRFEPTLSKYSSTAVVDGLSVYFWRSIYTIKERQKQTDRPPTRALFEDFESVGSNPIGSVFYSINGTSKTERQTTYQSYTWNLLRRGFESHRKYLFQYKQKVKKQRDRPPIRAELEDFDSVGSNPIGSISFSTNERSKNR